MLISELIQRFPPSSVLCIYYSFRVLMFLTSREMLCAAFSSAVGKKGKLYEQHMNWLENVYCVYVPRITGYFQTLTRYLVVGNLICAAASILLALLFALRGINPHLLSLIILICACLVMITFVWPTLIISLLHTSWAGGHPHVSFDIHADFPSKKDMEYRKQLMRYLRTCRLLSPEDFAVRKHGCGIVSLSKRRKTE